MNPRNRLRVPLLAVLAFAVAAAAAQAQEGLTAGRLALLSRGINLNDWFTSWSNPERYGASFTLQEAAFLKSAGFTFCRLPLSPDLLFDPSHPAVVSANIRYVDAAVKLLLGAGLAVVLDPIHESSATDEWERRLYNDPGFRSAVAAYWEALARHFAAISRDRIFFEVMNEPHLSAREKVAPSWWQPVQAELAAAIRRGAPENTIIATGEEWGSIAGLVALKPLADRNVVYSFHWYEPFTFTHQGATWTAPVQAELSGIPYPSSPALVAPAAAALRDPKARALVERYGKERWNIQGIRSGIAKAAAWAKANGVPLLCGEFGAYRKVAPEPDRLRWIADVRRTLESFGIGWSMWDYETDFGLVTFSEPQWRRGPIIDRGVLTALGLNAKASLPPETGGPTIADFASGRVTEIDIPVYVFARMWSRDTGSGTVAAIPGSAGAPDALEVLHRGPRDWTVASALRIPVRAGERLKLSSSASRSGSGSLELGLVARGSGGKVISWDFGRKAAPEGSGELSTVVVVPRGVATLEPLWSGVGVSMDRVGSFLLTRE